MGATFVHPRPRPHPNVYISLQTCHFLSVLEADVHVLVQGQPAHMHLAPLNHSGNKGHADFCMMGLDTTGLKGGNKTPKFGL